MSADEKASEAGSFAKEVRATFPVVHDPNSKIFEKFGVEPIPANVIIGRNGKVVASIEGADIDGITRAVSKAVGKK